MSPPNYSQIFFEICSPKPIPFVLISLVVSKKPKTLKSLSMSSWRIPMPVSMTWISSIPFVAFFKRSMNWRDGTVRSDWSLIKRVIILTEPPLLVNFKAFETKFKRTCYSLYLSAQTLKLFYSGISFFRTNKLSVII